MADGERFTTNNLITDILEHNFSKKTRSAVDQSDPFPEAPINFYDRHLDSDLSLLQVKVIPSLPRLLSTLCDDALEGFEPTTRTEYDFGVYLDPAGDEELRNTHELAEKYGRGLGRFCSYIASAACVHPDARTLDAVVKFQQRPTSLTRRPTFVVEAVIKLKEEFILPFNAELEYPVDKPVFSKLNRLAEYSPDLAIWNFYPITSSGCKILTKITDASFIWQTSNTRSGRQCQTGAKALIQPDADIQVISSILQAPNSKGRAKGKTGQTKAPRSRDSNVWPAAPRRNPNSDKPYRVEWQDFIQHAWARAVSNDATFIVLSCGKYERIGVRHRASRTLYLSECLSTTTCSSPTYGKLHLGLHLAIWQDALRRLHLRGNDTVPSTTTSTIGRNVEEFLGRKRARDPEDERPSGATKIRKVETSDNTQTSTIHSALSARDLFLVNLDYKELRSPVPSSFMRKGPSCAPHFYQATDTFVTPKRHKPYSSHQYVTITLSEPITAGATGTAHRGVAQVCLESGEVLMHRVVVKLVFPDKDTRPEDEVNYSLGRTGRERLLHEYSIYQHLAAAGCCDGILPVFGLFEDLDSGTLALILDDGGISLLTLKRRDKKAENEILSQRNREHLLQIIKKIHKAGIRHRDIGLRNIVMNDDDEVFIIDFDMAEYLSLEEDAHGALAREALLMEHTSSGALDWVNRYYSF